MPSEGVKPRTWKTHDDAFFEVWPTIETMLADSPALEAKTPFAWLLQTYPWRYEEGQLRTLQRRVKSWRAASGPHKDRVLRGASPPPRHSAPWALGKSFCSRGDARR